MTVNELKNIPEFRLLVEGDMNKEITRPFCCAGRCCMGYYYG